MINRLLNELYDIDGVEAVVVCSNLGTVIEKLSRKFTDDDLEWIAIYLLKIISAHHLKNQTIKDIEIFWENFHIITKVSPKFILISICISPRVLSLLRITQNVVLSHLLDDKKFMKMINKNSSDRTTILKSEKLNQLENNLISKLQ